ncbi:MAG: hypothetical protein JSS69_01465 [Acidobacteria bacterium]|nr:hypothetical protein [Acidobacteriota bacterium]MBS1864562.1 hypothetical protein [Acidobacteriota bacterium]
MFPVLKRVLFIVLLSATFLGSAHPAFSQDASSFTSVRYALVRSPQGEPSDPVENELLHLGSRGQLISRARSRVLAILSAENGCTNWYRKSEPDAEEIFRSLHFVIDLSGNAEIVKREDSFGHPEYLHPYVAHARQQEGSGAEIVLNASGAFFQKYARVSFFSAPPGQINQPVRLLVVGDFSGDSEQARILTLLHEFAHVVGLLPPDSGSPSAALLSVQNTRAVLKNCKSQIDWKAKHPGSDLPRSLLAAPVLAPSQAGLGLSALARVHREFAPPRQ